MIDIQGNCLEVGTPVIYATDKTYKYPNIRFYVKELNYVDGELKSVVVGRKRDKLANVSMSPAVATLSLLKVEVPHNKVMDDMDFIEMYGVKHTNNDKVFTNQRQFEIEAKRRGLVVNGNGSGIVYASNRSLHSAPSLEPIVHCGVYHTNINLGCIKG